MMVICVSMCIKDVIISGKVNVMGSSDRIVLYLFFEGGVQ